MGLTLNMYFNILAFTRRILLIMLAKTINLLFHYATGIIFLFVVLVVHFTSLHSVNGISFIFNSRNLFTIAQLYVIKN